VHAGHINVKVDQVDNDEANESVTEKKSKIIHVHCFLSIQN